MPRPRPWAALSGIGRSLALYQDDPAHHHAMDALYAGFLRPGDLAFDIGAHVGDRVASFRRLGARVVAVEPQPRAARAIALLFRRDHDVTVLRAGVSDRSGSLTLRINTRNPTISTASDAFVAAADGAPGWEGQVWDSVVTVPALTLDDLVARFGRPAFVKIDVEGFEYRVLAGLSAPLPSLSFEFTTIQRDVALACLDRLMTLGRYRFDAALGESQTLSGDWVDGPAMAAMIRALPHAANSGDVYARLVPADG